MKEGGREQNAAFCSLFSVLFLRPVSTSCRPRKVGKYFLLAAPTTTTTTSTFRQNGEKEKERERERAVSITPTSHCVLQPILG